jgi:hypothetical protein
MLSIWHVKLQYNGENSFKTLENIHNKMLAAEIFLQQMYWLKDNFKVLNLFFFAKGTTIDDLEVCSWIFVAIGNLVFFHRECVLSWVHLLSFSH